MFALYADTFLISPYVFSCFVSLREKGVAFDLKPVAMERGEQGSSEYQRVSLTKRVPAIDHDGFQLSESSAIVEYLDDVFPSPEYVPALPRNPRERARARQVMAFLRSDLLPIRDERSTVTMFYERAKQPLSPLAERARDKLLAFTDAVVPDGATSLFETFSTADADLAFMLHRLLLNGDEVTPKAATFARAQWQRPSIRSFVAMNRAPYVPYQYV